MFDLQDSTSHKRLKEYVTMAEREEHQNVEEQMSTQKLLNTMVASPNLIEGRHQSHSATVPKYEE